MIAGVGDIKCRAVGCGGDTVRRKKSRDRNRSIGETHRLFDLNSEGTGHDDGLDSSDNRNLSRLRVDTKNPVRLAFSDDEIAIRRKRDVARVLQARVMNVDRPAGWNLRRSKSTDRIYVTRLNR